MDEERDKPGGNESRPALTIDWDLYEAMLEEYECSDDQKRELIETLWSIVLTFVDFGFGIGSPALPCGQLVDEARLDEGDVLSSLTKSPEHLNQAHPHGSGPADRRRSRP